MFRLSFNWGMFTIKARLEASYTDIGGYIVYVFKNMDSESWESAYLTVVRFPNWSTYLPKVGDTGFLKYKTVIAGDDMWWDKNNNKKVAYNYDNIIFLDFIKEQKEEENTVLL